MPVHTPDMYVAPTQSLMQPAYGGYPSVPVTAEVPQKYQGQVEEKKTSPMERRGQSGEDSESESGTSG